MQKRTVLPNFFFKKLKIRIHKQMLGTKKLLYVDEKGCAKGLFCKNVANNKTKRLSKISFNKR